MPVTVQDKLRIFMARFTILLRDQVKTNIMDRFKVVTGEFPQAVQSEQIEQPGSVTGRVFIDTLPWAGIQERGGKTPPHVIQPATANALAFLMPARLGFSSGSKSSALMFAQKINHPGSTIPERTICGWPWFRCGRRLKAAFGNWLMLALPRTSPGRPYDQPRRGLWNSVQPG
jgi:hypothetical protein